MTKRTPKNNANNSQAYVPKVIPLVLCGGFSKRLWPIEQPKQFCRFFSEYSLMQHTLFRGAMIPNAVSPWIITNEQFVRQATQQCQEVKGKLSEYYGKEAKPNVVVEPCSRNTGPAVAISALLLRRQYNPEDIVVMMPSDHDIQGDEAFTDTINRAIDVASKGHITVIGIPPSGPNTGYGYIEYGDAISSGMEVNRFIEKPNAVKAQALIEQGNVLWNAGIYVFQLGTMLSELERIAQQDYNYFCPIAEHILPFNHEAHTQWLIPHAYQQCVDIPIDKLVMEKTAMGGVAMATFTWQDLGTWNALDEMTSRDKQGNVIIGHVLTEDVQNTYIHSTTGRPVVVMGVDNLVVVDTPDGVLVTRKELAPDLSQMVPKIKKNTSTVG